MKNLLYHTCPLIIAMLLYMENVYALNIESLNNSEHKLEEIVRLQNKSIKNRDNLEFIHISQFEPKFMINDSIGWSNLNSSLIIEDSIKVSLGLFRRRIPLPNTHILIFSNGKYLGEARSGNKWKIDPKVRVFSELQASFMYKFGSFKYYIRKGGNVGQIDQLFCLKEGKMLTLVMNSEYIYKTLELKTYIKENWFEFKERLLFKMSVAG